IVVIRPRSMPMASLRTLAIGARQLVVQDAFEMIVCAPGSYLSSLTPSTTVTSSFLAGAEMITFLAPLSACTRALLASVNRPVDSSTTSAPRSPHGSFAGSRSAKTLIVLPPTAISSAVAFTSSGSRPRMLSYLSRWAGVALSVRSLTATISMSAPLALTARQKLRPMRPNPLTPTRMVTEPISSSSSSSLCPAKVPGRNLVCGNSHCRPYRTNASDPAGDGAPIGPSGCEHLGGQGRLGPRDALVAGPLVRHGQQPADAAGDGVLGERRGWGVGKLFERGLLLL